MNPERRPTNLAASVRAKLFDASRKRNVEFQLILAEFAIERLLYRLGSSPFADRFVLKGAMLFKLWSDVRGRATWDLDLLGRGASGVEDVAGVIREICGLAVDDGIVFDVGTVVAEPIRAADEYAGVRVRLQAGLADARIPVQIDVGFGDAVVPPPVLSTYPTLLDQPAPRILAYPREAVVAEKLEAILSLGLTNSRIKDFHDVHLLATSFAFEGPSLVRAIRSTFERRSTPWPEGVPLVLTRAFLAAPEQQVHWRAFLRRGRLGTPPDAGRIADELQQFLLPPLTAAAQGADLDASWAAAGPWRARATPGG
jgi:Nucleotidyl transferase AbiEii toxin, Type IV TA system